MERKEGEKNEEVRVEVNGEVEQLRDNRTCAWREDGMTDSRDDLSQCGCDTCVMKNKTSTSVQACSDLHVAHVHVRCVTVVIVHIGHEGVLVVIYFCVAIFVSDLLYQEMYSLHPPSVTVDCVDCYRYNHDKFCTKFLLRFIPQMKSLVH